MSFGWMGLRLLGLKTRNRTVSPGVERRGSLVRGLVPLAGMGLLLAAMPVLLGGCLSLFSPPSPPANFSIQGVVRSYSTGAPVANAAVSIGDKTTVTGADGRYALMDIPVGTGTVQLQCGAAGFMARQDRISGVQRGQSLDYDVYLLADGTAGRISGTISYSTAAAPTLSAAASAARPTTAASGARVLPLQRSPAPAGISSPARDVLVKFRAGTSRQDVQRYASAHGAFIVRYNDVLDAWVLRPKAGAQEVEPLARSLAVNANVVYAEPNLVLHALEVPVNPSPVYPNDTYFGAQWNLRMINMPQAWTLSKGSTTIKVAVIDTGIQADHPDLRGHVQGGWNLWDNNNNTDDVGIPNGSGPRIYHGTHVAGIIGALTNNSMGVAGVAWNLTLVPYRVFDNQGHADMDLVAEAIRRAVSDGVRVINLSLGVPPQPGQELPQTMKEALDYAEQNGVVVVAAAGNEGGSSIDMPASYPTVIAVGAVEPNGNRPAYSNTGPELDLMAPGGADSGVASDMILSTHWSPDNVPTYDYMAGTSMAAPHVAAVAALLEAEGIQDPRKIRDILCSTARDLGSPGRDDEYGYGLLDAYAALGGSRPAPPLTAARVFAGSYDAGSESILVQSYYGYPNSGGAYSFPALAGSQTVFGWVDVDGDGRISAGDYFGSRGPVSVAAGGATTGVDFTLAPVPPTGATALPQAALGGLPANLLEVRVIPGPAKR
ncbi:MAG: S8 family serine peptidase [Firmicutes bacterium]|nr:S8 family serine peptidase [Bacillota bacterium]